MTDQLASASERASGASAVVGPVHLEVPALAVADGCFTVRGATDLADFDLDHPDLALCRRVLEAVSTSHGIEGTDARAEIWASLPQQLP